MKLDNKRTVLIGLSFMGILAFWQLYDQVVPYLLESQFGLKTFAANANLATLCKSCIADKCCLKTTVTAALAAHSAASILDKNLRVVVAQLK